MPFKADTTGLAEGVRLRILIERLMPLEDEPETNQRKRVPKARNYGPTQEEEK